MATAIAVEEKWKVIIDADEEDHEKVYKLPVSTTVEEVLTKWKEDVEVEGRWALKKTDGPRLGGDEKLIEVGEYQIGKKLVHLYVEKMEDPASEETVMLNFGIFGRSEDVQQIEVQLCQKPEEVYDDIRMHFRVLDGRSFQLRTEDGLLRYNLTFGEQKIPANTLVLIDVAYEIQVQDIWSKAIDVHLVHSSEVLQDILLTDCTYKKRIYLGSRLLDMGRDLASILPPHVLNLAKFRVHTEYQRSVTLLVGEEFMRHQVWPQDKLKKVMPGKSCHKTWKYEGKSVVKSQTFMEIGLQDEGLILQDRPVAVRYSDGEAAVVWLPVLSSVADLRQEIMKKEVDGDFHLKCGKRILEPDEALGDKSIFGKRVEVERSENRFSVTFPKTSVTWISRKGNMRFSQFCYELLKEGKVEWIDLAEMEFVCDGCGRRICRNEEEYQLLPADCCHVRSLSLSSFEPVEMKGAATQGQVHIQHPVSAREKKIGRRLPVGDGSCQTRLEAVTEATGTQAGLGGQAASTQHPPPPPPPPPPPREQRPFYLYNDTGAGPFRGWKEVSLLLPAAPSVGETRAAVAQLLDRKVDEIRICRRFTVSRGDRVVEALDGEERMYTTEDGRRTVQNKDAKNVNWELLTDDAATLILPPRRCLALEAWRQWL